MEENDRRQLEDRNRYFAERQIFMDAAFDAWAAQGGTEDDFDEPPYPELEEVNYYEQLVNDHLDKAGTQTWPDSKPSYDGGLDEVKKTVSLRDKTVQVIVKLANIVLTPEKPEYAGGTWHVEGECCDQLSKYRSVSTSGLTGMDNEAIVSTFIYVSGYTRCAMGNTRLTVIFLSITTRRTSRSLPCPSVMQ